MTVSMRLRNAGNKKDRRQCTDCFARKSQCV